MLAIARECPVVEMGGSLKVSECVNVPGHNRYNKMVLYWLTTIWRWQ